ncbi:MAG: Crp/Fnr family transcriptional regulator [Sporocytophaga sp.]|uniref:Crp/Fnr family transcriptional regulator n=1 Tax=Sporocytophaga sp. TaxID=2231183 RepID=UPI001B237826|nr:Crp/Fnr family transcriptional regulator [Sporocytophaga sp.]MBO9698934.1 Crp/Fnr family transcriptional regulator [Sporocytophaga sp.]
MEQNQSNPTSNELIKYISKYIKLTEEETNAILKDLDIRFYKKGDILIKEGEVPELCYFIFKGCVRQYFNKDGEERTTEFYTEGQPIAVFQGTNGNKKSPFYLSCLEDCVMSVGPIVSEDTDIDPRFINLCKTAAEDELCRTQETLAIYRLSNPEERYLDLMKTKPELIERVPQYYLASYLGIKPESLSRIRKRLTKKA